MRYAGETQACIDEKLLGLPLTIRKLLDHAKDRAQTPLQAAITMAQQRIAAGQHPAPNTTPTPVSSHRQPSPAMG